VTGYHVRGCTGRVHTLSVLTGPLLALSTTFSPSSTSRPSASTRSTGARAVTPFGGDKETCGGAGGGKKLLVAAVGGSPGGASEGEPLGSPHGSLYDCCSCHLGRCSCCATAAAVGLMGLSPGGIRQGLKLGRQGGGWSLELWEHFQFLVELFCICGAGGLPPCPSALPSSPELPGGSTSCASPGDEQAQASCLGTRLGSPESWWSRVGTRAGTEGTRGCRDV